MKLTSREIEYLAGIDKRRKRRRIGAWIGLVLLLVLLAIEVRFGLYGGGLATVLAVFIGVVVSTLAHEYFGVSAENKLLDLLQRYVNSDPEAVRQIAGRTDADRRSP